MLSEFGVLCSIGRRVPIGLYLGIAFVVSAAALSAQPANDRCEDAIDIAPGVLSGSSIGATADGSSSCDFFNARDVWFRYTPIENGTFFTTTCSADTDFQTVVSFHAECPDVSGAEFGCNDGDLGCSFDRSHASLSYPVEANRTYFVRVSGFGGQAGEYELTIDGPPVRSNRARPDKDGGETR